MNRKLFCLLPALFLLSCTDVTTGGPASAYPDEIRFTSAPGMQNRHVYEITGPDWEAEHVEVADTVWLAGKLPLEDDGQLVPQMNEPAPYTANTPMRLEVVPATRGYEIEQPTKLTVTARGRLHSTTDRERAPIDLFTVEDTVEATGSAVTISGEPIVVTKFEPLVIETDRLPARIDLYELRIDWTYEFSLDQDVRVVENQSRHLVPLSWRNPIEEAPLYKRSVLWSAAWAAGEYADAGAEHPDTLESEHQISLALMNGIRNLEARGYSYGRFPRPPRDQIEDRVDVFLDFKRSACGEFRGLLMGLIEFHGIDAYWVWFRFPEPDDENDPPNQYFRRYLTRSITAVGREKKQWTATNHIIVGVNGRVYDPTYTVAKDDWEQYEDWMFESYCGEDKNPEPEDCIANPSGFSDDDELGLRVIIADNYK